MVANCGRRPSPAFAVRTLSLTTPTRTVISPEAGLKPDTLVTLAAAVVLPNGLDGTVAAPAPWGAGSKIWNGKQPPTSASTGSTYGSGRTMSVASLRLSVDRR